MILYVSMMMSPLSRLSTNVVRPSYQLGGSVLDFLQKFYVSFKVRGPGLNGDLHARSNETFVCLYTFVCLVNFCTSKAFCGVN